ncbi:MAG: PEP-CTERM sorting domain-containing protein [Rhodoferax sp.]|nr:PEP-CTERM sorting domain-containing protein [Rhodoferax sp.]
MFNTLHKSLALSVVSAALFASAAQAATPATPYSGLVIFGDSLSDTGNVLSLTKNTAFPFPNFPGAAGRFSDGKVWTEYLAEGLGLANAAKPANLYHDAANTFNNVVAIGALGGSNFAYGGARTGLGGSAGATTGLGSQLVNWNGSLFGTSLTRAADPNALYVVVAGANDLRDARSSFATGSAADTLARFGAANAAASNVVNSLNLLASAGARNFMISSLPDLGKTPEAVFGGTSAASTDITLKFNSALAANAGAFDSFFQGLTGVDLDIRTLDFYGLFETVVANPAAYGISNLTLPCITPGPSGQYFAPGAVGNNCSGSAFSDPLHPSSRSHELLGQLAITTAVPEPSSIAMMAMGILVIGGIVRRRRVSAA